MNEKTERSAMEPPSNAALTTTTQAPLEREHRQVYGTAKTESLRDSGFWRIFLPVAVIVFCAALVIIPLGILIPILYNALTASAGTPESQLIWLWIGLIIIEMGLVYLIVRGISRIFFTQAGNYQRAR